MVATAILGSRRIISCDGQLINNYFFDIAFFIPHSAVFSINFDGIFVGVISTRYYEEMKRRTHWKSVLEGFSKYISNHIS
jgi:hypothetical protein